MHTLSHTFSSQGNIFTSCSSLNLVTEQRWWRLDSSTSFWLHSQSYQSTLSWLSVDMQPDFLDTKTHRMDHWKVHVTVCAACTFNLKTYFVQAHPSIFYHYFSSTQSCAMVEEVAETYCSYLWVKGGLSQSHIRRQTTTLNHLRPIQSLHSGCMLFRLWEEAGESWENPHRCR